MTSPRSANSNPNRVMKRNFWVVLVFGAVVTLWCLCPVLVMHLYGRPENPGAFGDIFGAVNSLFAGLAFGGIVLTIFIQRKELEQHTVEFAKSADAFAQQVDLMRLSAKLSALPELIRQEKERIWTMDKNEFKAVRDENYTTENLQEFIEKGENRLKATMQRLREIEADAAKTPGDQRASERRFLSHRRETDEKSIAAFKRLLKYVSDLESIYFAMDKEKC